MQNICYMQVTYVLIIHPPESVADGPAAAQHHEKSALQIAGPGKQSELKVPNTILHGCIAFMPLESQKNLSQATVSWGPSIFEIRWSQRYDGHWHPKNREVQATWKAGQAEDAAHAKVLPWGHRSERRQCGIGSKVLYPDSSTSLGQATEIWTPLMKRHVHFKN